jgi:cytidylate kinase
VRHDVITISREYGAGASELAALLGERLGWRVLDREIPAAVARRLRIPDEALEEWDEHAPGLLESIGSSLMLGSPELLLDATYVRRPNAHDVAERTNELLREAIASPPLIIVEHGAQVLFHDRPRTLHLRLVAPMEVRSRRIMERRPGTRHECIALAQYIDRDRTHYLQQFHGRDARDPMLYALQINTGVVTMSDCVRLVLELLHDATA